LVGVEAFPGALLQIIRNVIQGRIFNMYGPTETTIWSTVKELSGVASINIGKPIANTQIYIVDKGGKAQPVGVVGELCIGGDGLARGYLNRPELTSEKFLNFSHNISFCGSFFQKQPVENTLYKTGDLARWLSDGNIECLGRLDSQVKIRGFRIELEEIENRLRSHKQVREVVVFVKDKDENKYLCAAIVGESSLDVTVLRDFLSGYLPNYMIPSQFFEIDKMPLTPNGKIDKNGLQTLKGLQIGSDSKYIAPETETEKIVAQLFREVLQQEIVGMQDNFFNLGGNSLRVLQLNQKLKEVFFIDIPVTELFRNLTVEFLAQYINRQNNNEDKKEEEIKKTVVMDSAKKLFLNTTRKMTGGINE
jgi:acyl carrier protein